jgi:hypothetical protein
MARHLMTDYGINIFENKFRWNKCFEFCQSWSEEEITNPVFFSNAVFLFANKIQRGEI